jgi:hypothetical protein
MLPHQGEDRAVLREGFPPGSGLPRLIDARSSHERERQGEKFRQITTAVADGTIAALAVQKFLRESRG